MESGGEISGQQHVGDELDAGISKGQQEIGEEHQTRRAPATDAGAVLDQQERGDNGEGQQLEHGLVVQHQ